MNERVHDDIPELVRFVGFVHDPPAKKCSNMMVPGFRN